MRVAVTGAYGYSGFARAWCSVRSPPTQGWRAERAEVVSPAGQAAASLFGDAAGPSGVADLLQKAEEAGEDVIHPH